MNSRMGITIPALNSNNYNNNNVWNGVADSLGSLNSDFLEYSSRTGSDNESVLGLFSSTPPSVADSDEEFNNLWKTVCKSTKETTELPEIKYRVIRGRGFFSKTNVTNLTTPLPPALCYRPLSKVKSCVFCVKVNPESSKTHNMKEHDRVVCPSLRAYTCPICGTPDKNKAHTVRFCPKNQFW